VRGSKPMAVLREWGIPAHVTIPEPNTWREILAAIEGRADLPASKPVGNGKASTSLLLGSLVPCFRVGKSGLRAGHIGRRIPALGTFFGCVECRFRRIQTLLSP